jgi:hypothetical protein
MKNILPVLCIIPAFMMLSLNGLHAETSGPGEVVAAYFNALKNGNTETVKTLIIGKLYQKRIKLLQNNQDYSTFLIRFYDGVNVRIVNTVEEDDEAYVAVEMVYEDGNFKPITLVLKKDGNDNWKISDEIERPEI